MTPSDPDTIHVEREPVIGLDPAAPAHATAAHWSSEQLTRLNAEWQRLQRAYAYHPVVRILPIHGNPPDQYQIEYRLRTLVMTEGERLEYATSCALHMWLGPAFPLEPPLIRPITRLFHPNIVPQGVNLARVWTGQNTSLLEVVRGVGAMVALQQYDPDSQAVWNDSAMEWIVANPRHVPVDAEADLSPQAGGEPLARIARFGPRTIEQVRFELKRICDAIVLPEGGAAPREIQAVCNRARGALALFLADDIPQDLRAQAHDLDEWARGIPAAGPAWELFRRYRGAASRALEVAQQMRESKKLLSAELGAIDALVTSDPKPSVAETVRLLPAGGVLQLHQRTLEQLLTRVAGELNEARNAYTRLQGLPRLNAATLSEPSREAVEPQTPPAPAQRSVDSALHKRMESEATRARQLVAEASEKLKEIFVRLDPLSGRGKIHFAALRRMAEWRQYVDLIERAEGIVSLATELGPEGLHSYFIENESGRFGPFELEQHVQIGSLDIAVRLAAPGALEIIDAQTGKPLNRGAGGILVVQVDDPKTGNGFATTFQYAGECDDLANQLSDSIYQATQVVDALAARIRAPEGWLGRVYEALSAASAGNRLATDHQILLKRWSAVCDDLLALKRFKERLATLRLLQRVEVLAPSLISRQAEAKRVLEHATDRVAAIVAGSSRDEDTGRLLIPHRFAREYAEQLQGQDDARAAIEHFQRLLAAAADDVRRRMNDGSLRGVAGLPRLQSLTIIPGEWEALAQMSLDDELTRRLTRLEGLLSSPLRPLDAFPVTPLEEIEENRAQDTLARTSFGVTSAPDEPTDNLPGAFSSDDKAESARVVEELEVVELGEFDVSPPAPSRLPPPPQPR